MLIALLIGPGSAFSALASSQEISGSIQGTVKDPAGAVIPDASITATSDRQTFKTTSDSAGNYTISSLPPGVYVVTASGTGFKSVKREKVPVELGKTLQVNFDMEVAVSGEEVTITAADEPLVDVTSTKTATNVTQQEINVIPKTLNFSSLIQVAPGTRAESKTGGFQIDGASGAENTFIVDGVEVTRIEDGTLGRTKNIPNDFVKELQVKSAGYEAEYGGATGGVVNVVTRGGTNDFHGELRFEYTSDTFRAEDNPTLRLAPENQDTFDYFENRDGKDKTRFFSPIINIGGPILKDHVWFYTSYAPQYTKTTRRTDLIRVNPGVGVDSLDTRFITQREKIDYFLGRLDWAASDRLSVYGNFINSPVKTEGSLLAQEVSSSTSFNDIRLGEKGGFVPSWQAAFGANYSATDHLILSFRGGHTYLNDKGTNYDIPVGVPLYTISVACAPPLSGCAAGSTTTGTPIIQTNFSTAFNITRRTNLNFDATYITRFLGQQHTFKGGYQVNRLSNKVNEAYQGGIINFYFGRTYLGESGTYGYYRVTDFGTEGDVNSKNQGFFVQDQWQIHPRLTANIGLRIENEFLPAFPIDTRFHPTIPADAQISTKPIDFGWGDKIAPRVGLAWDVFGTGKLKVYGSFSIFYDTMKYELPRGSFGGDHFIRTWYELNTPDFTSINLGNTPGNIIDGPLDFRVPSNVVLAGERPTIDPNLKPTREREYTVGGDYALGTNLVASARLTRKKLDRTIEDIGGLDAAGNEVYTIGNPGFGVSITDFNPATPKAVREYTGLELRLDKRFTNNWYANLSYTYSKLYGNYSGLASSDEVDAAGNGRTSPNVNRYFDLPELVYDTHGNQVLGRLATDRPNTFKAFASYQFHYWGMTTDVGGTQLIYQGTPISTILSEHVGGGGAEIYPEGRGDLGRTETFTQTDLVVNHLIKLTENVKLRFSMNVFNLFDERNVTNIFANYLAPGQVVQYGNANDSFDVAFPIFINSNGDWQQRIAAQGLAVDPRFGKASNFQAPREARFAVGVQW